MLTCKWEGGSLLLATQDILTADDNVQHGDLVHELWAGGATPHQALAIARDYSNLQITLSIPSTAETSEMSMTKGFRTGGKYEPDAFVMMFDEVLDYLSYEWNLMT